MKNQIKKSDEKIPIPLGAPRSVDQVVCGFFLSSVDNSEFLFYYFFSPDLAKIRSCGGRNGSLGVLGFLRTRGGFSGITGMEVAAVLDTVTLARAPHQSLSCSVMSGSDTSSC